MSNLILLLTLCLGVIVSEGTLPVFTAREKADIDKLRRAVGEKLTATYMKSDAYLIKWLKAKKFDHTQAKEALEKTLEWRKMIDADNLPAYDFGAEMNKRFVLDYSAAKDIGGNPIGMIPFGDWNLRRKALAGKLTEISRRLNYAEEMAAQLSFNATGDPTSMFIGDFNGFGLRTHACTACIPVFTGWAIRHERYYPYNFYRILIINAPKIFDPIFNLMKPLMTAATREATLIIGHDRAEQAAEIAKFANLDGIPIRFGGNKRQKS